MIKLLSVNSSYAYGIDRRDVRGIAERVYCALSSVARSEPAEAAPHAPEAANHWSAFFALFSMISPLFDEAI